ncbi:hypothetical protein ACFL2T_02000 [Elusimicrobiota bacterium]
MIRNKHEEVGDLFVTDSILTVKLLPSKKSASKPISWFNDGVVTDHSAAAKDIAHLVSRVKGKSRIVRGLTLMTDRGVNQDLNDTGLPRVVTKAGYTPLVN